MNPRSRKKGKHERTEKEKQLRTMDLILIVVAILLVAFTITMIILFNRTGMIPDTLCTCVFACLGGECGAMAWIKTTKDRFREREWEQEDKKDQLKEDETHEP
jgi:hypothetical protein